MLHRPEQAVTIRDAECAVLPQESTDSLNKEAPQSVQLDGYSPIAITCNGDDFTFVPQKSFPREVGYWRTVGDRHSDWYGDSDDSRPSNSDEENLEDTETADEEFIRSCTKIFSNCLARRISRAMIDLVGIEPNPGPVTGKKLSNLLNNLVQSSKGKSKQGKGKKNKSRSQGKQNSGATAANNTRVTGIPAAFGLVAPRSYFKTSSTAQQMTQQDAKGSIRVHGCALFGSPIGVYTASTTNATQGALAASTRANQGYFNISPTSIDPRLAAVSQTYQFYAFRKIRLRYIPFVGTSTTGGLYLGVAKDAEQAAASFAVVGAASGNSVGTTQNVMEYDPSLMTAIWQPAQIDFQHFGTDLWETYPNGEEPIDSRLQAAVVALTEGVTVSASTQYIAGHLWFEYEVDFYVPGPPLGSS